MEELIKGQHDDNIEGINRIISSINAYFIYMQDNHGWRDGTSNSKAMDEWRRKFSLCKENLQNFYSEIAVVLTEIKYKKNVSEDKFKEFVEVVKSLPEISKNTTTNYNPRWDSSLVSTSSNIDIAEIWKITYKTQSEDIPKLLSKIIDSLKNYNYWLAELELNQTQNYKALGWFENTIKTLFMDNEEARSLKKHILTYSFNSLPLIESTNKNNNKIINL